MVEPTTVCLVPNAEDAETDAQIKAINEDKELIREEITIPDAPRSGLLHRLVMAERENISLNRNLQHCVISGEKTLVLYFKQKITGTIDKLIPVFRNNWSLAQRIGFFKQLASLFSDLHTLGLAHNDVGVHSVAF